MEVKKDVTNINRIKELLKSNKIDELISTVKKTKQSIDGVIRGLGEKEQILKTRRIEEEREQSEKQNISAVQSDVDKDSVAVGSEEKTKSLKPKNANSESQNKVENDNSNVASKKTEKSDEKKTVELKPEKSESVQSKGDSAVEVKKTSEEKNQRVDASIKSETKDSQNVENKTETKIENKTDNSAPKPRMNINEYFASKGIEKPQRKEYVPQSQPRDRRPQNGQGGYQTRQQNGQGGYQTRQQNGQGGYQNRQQNGQGGYQNRPQNGQGGYQNRPQNGQGGYQNRQQNGQGGYQNRSNENKPYAPRPMKPEAVAFIPKETKSFNNTKKKTSEKSYEDKHAINKKQLIKSNVSINDFDEDKSGYRKLRTKKTPKTKEEQRIKIERAVINKEIIPLKELSEKIGISAVEITKVLFKEGIIKTINDSIDYDTAGFVAASLGIELELKLDKTAEDVLSEGFNEELDDADDYITRPPVVTVMGHVDHGKTSLLDRIRSTNVTSGEAGGITQHIGAYSVSVKGNKITFLDTPGHAAFTAMRARGAQVTDIAVIVIAADDGIMPQTIEAINHAKAANVSIIVAANKIDKPHASIDKVRQQLTEQGIVVEDWGGDVILVPVSAKTGEGIDNLLDSILLIAEMRDLKANPNRKAKGAVVEAKLDKGKGPVATIIVQNGTLRLGDNIVAGTIVGKVRAMFDDKGRMIKEAGPSMAVSVLGLESVPNAGDIIFAVDQEKLTKLVAEERKNKEREEMIRQQQKVSLDELFSKINGGDLKVLNLIIKADVQGSVEAVKQSLEELSDEQVKVAVIHSGVGAINETDVMLGDSSNSIIIGFNVRPDANAKTLAERTKVDVKLYRIIYEAIDDIKKAMKGMLAPKFKEVYLGKAEVRETFKITGVGVIAGSYVTEGKILRNSKLRIYRDDVMICEGNVLQLKRFKDDVKEVAQGFECGISIENFNDIKVGDFIESYIVEEDK